MSEWCVLWNATNLYFCFVLFVFCVSFFLFLFLLFMLLLHVFGVKLPKNPQLWSAWTSESITLSLILYWFSLWPFFPPWNWWFFFFNYFLLFFGCFLTWNELAVLVFGTSLTAHGPAITSCYHFPLCGCSPALTAVLTPSFLSRPLPPLTGLTPTS